MKTKYDYDKENDIMFVNFGGKVETSLEVLDGRIVLDFGENAKLVGFEELMEEFEK